MISVTSGTDVTDVDAGMYSSAPAMIGDRIWDDRDGDGVQDPGEPGLAGVVVELFDALDLSTPVASAETGGDGSYAFEGVDAGSDYVVAVYLPGSAIAFAPSGAAIPGLDSDVDANGLSSPIVVEAGGSYPDAADAGVVFPVSIGDLVWFDIDGDGVVDAGEPGIAGVTVELFDGSGGVVARVITDHGGRFAITGLYPGTYRLAVDPATLPPGLDVPTTVGGLGFTAAGGATITTQFGFIGSGVIGDTVWHDVDGNGVQNGEPGIPEVELTVLWLGFDGIMGTGDDIDFGTQTTSELGHYLFTGLPFGEYMVTSSDPPFPYLRLGPDALVVMIDASVAGAGLAADFPLVLATEALPTTGVPADVLFPAALAIIALGAAVLRSTRRREAIAYKVTK